MPGLCISWNQGSVLKPRLLAGRRVTPQQSLATKLGSQAPYAFWGGSKLSQIMVLIQWSITSEMLPQLPSCWRMDPNGILLSRRELSSRRGPIPCLQLNFWFVCYCWRSTHGLPEYTLSFLGPRDAFMVLILGQTHQYTRESRKDWTYSAESGCCCSQAGADTSTHSCVPDSAKLSN